MINRHHLPATDQVLAGATLRDRFLTAFILRNAGAFPGGMAAQPEAVCYPGSVSPDELDMDALSFSVIQGGPPGGTEHEPIAMIMIEDWPFTGEDDDR